ncbi:hypothetical protein B0H15DRAFT_951661 [Mycena belliarum]|uniref:Uncharacterized protein n=1 Tax=Mycena belliarum TaxID=1033014 RepID=A0AAD6U0W7_9AGAR|nr:hypothetical protein B0H15DRAFT_951661 [Mycena belliae]
MPSYAVANNIDVARVEWALKYKTQGLTHHIRGLLWVTGERQPVAVTVPFSGLAADGPLALGVQHWISAGDVTRTTCTITTMDDAGNDVELTTTAFWLLQTPGSLQPVNVAVAAMMSGPFTSWHGNILVVGSNKAGDIFHDITGQNRQAGTDAVLCLLHTHLRPL